MVFKPQRLVCMYQQSEFRNKEKEIPEAWIHQHLELAKSGVSRTRNWKAVAKAFRRNRMGSEEYVFKKWATVSQSWIIENSKSWKLFIEFGSMNVASGSHWEKHYRHGAGWCWNRFRCNRKGSSANNCLPRALLGSCRGKGKQGQVWELLESSS